MFLVPMTRSASELSRSFDRLFDDGFFDRFFAPATRADNGMRLPALDVSETEQTYTVKLEMPGVTKDDIKVTIDGRRVTVQAQASTKDEKKEGDRVIYSERSMSSYDRTFMLPAEVDQRESGAKFDNGVLTLTLAKRGPASGAQLTIS
jgi:HSP20 family protein